MYTFIASNRKPNNLTNIAQLINNISHIDPSTPLNAISILKLSGFSCAPISLDFILTMSPRFLTIKEQLYATTELINLNSEVNQLCHYIRSMQTELISRKSKQQFIHLERQLIASFLTYSQHVQALFLSPSPKYPTSPRTPFSPDSLLSLNSPSASGLFPIINSKRSFCVEGHSHK